LIISIDIQRYLAVFSAVYRQVRRYFPCTQPKKWRHVESDTVVKNAKPADKPHILADEKWMSLYVTPARDRLWRMKYRFEGKEKLLSFGGYPDVSLKDARERRDETRKLLANGIDPVRRKRRGRP
jgi:hypothetical protein